VTTMASRNGWLRLGVDASERAQALRALALSARFTQAGAGPELALPVAGVNIEIPDLSAFPSAREKAKELLRLAAGIEHALLAQYLYVGYSSEVVKKTCVQIATEEMAHLMTVQNLLLLLGLPPTVRRADRQDTTQDPIVPFDLRFEKLSKQVLARYIVTESPAFDASNPLPPVVLQQAGAGHVTMIAKVGVLYALLGVVFGTEAVLAAREAADGTNWSKVVRALGDTIVADTVASAAYGGRAGMHLADTEFQRADSPFLARQATDGVWDRSKGQESFRIFAPKNRAEALDALQDITIQGEAPISGSPNQTSHFVRFLEQYQRVYGADGAGPEPAGTRDVPSGPLIKLEANDGDASTISSPAALPWARLAQLRYWLLLGALDQYLASPPDDRDFLVAWCFTEMYHLKVLGEQLGALPRTVGGQGSAAIPFNQPALLPSETAPTSVVSGTRTAWPGLMSEWFAAAIALAETLRGAATTDVSLKQQLDHMLEVDRRKLLEATLRKTGSTSRTTFDHVREILEWASGAGRPPHGRFWNQPIDDLRNASVFGETVIGPDASSSALFVQLQSGDMPPPPRGGLNTPEHQPKIDAIKSWLDAGTPTGVPMPGGGVSDIRELRLLPSLAMARLGSSPQPMDNYVREVVAGRSYRELHPAETLIVNELDGSIARASVPAALNFKDAAGRVKPVCPFLEVWALYDGADELRPLTLKELAQLGVDPSSIRWRVRVGNLKMFRRTGRAGDRVTAEATVADHEAHALSGRAGNFKVSRSVKLGSVRYVRPTPEFPEIRLRFTPAEGRVYGPAVDSNVPAERAVYDAVNGTWDNHRDATNPTSPAPRARLSTAPGGIFARTASGQNLGYLDDSCDGIVSVHLTLKGRELTAQARVAAGPPDYAPDILPVRTVADDLEQLESGPDVDDVSADEIIEIVRRAVETVRAIGLENQNASFPFWVEAAQNPFGSGLSYASTVAVHDNLLQLLSGLKAPPASPERAAAHASLTRIAGALRASDEAANYANPGNSQSPGVRQMPALMRGADGELLALTRRQRAKVLLGAEKFRPEPAGPQTPRGALTRMIQALQFGATAHSAIRTDPGDPLSSVFAQPDRVIAHLEIGKVQGSGPAAPFVGQPLIVRGDPAASAFLKIVSTPGHTMQSILNNYRDPNSNQNGFQVLAAWIASL
jgi:hypothetical protein